MVFKRFLKSSSGNIAIMFSLAAVPLLLGAGAASDILRANNANTVLQAATDAAALAGVAGKNNKLNADKIALAVNSFLESNGANKILKNVTVVDTGFDAKGVFHVKMTGKIETTFMALAGFHTMDVIGYSEVEAGSGGLEVALVLDTTGSMNAQGRLAALKVSANDLIDKLLTDKAADSYIKIGIVPFADYVNVGVSNKDKSWMDVPSTVPQMSCWNTYPNATYSNCRMETFTGINDGAATSWTSQVCDWVNGTAVQQCGLNAPVWNGVVGSRNNGLDTKLKGTGNPYPGLLYQVGPQAITQLTDSKATLLSSVNSLTANAETYIPAGLLWGWELLDASEPFLGAKTQAEMTAVRGKKALVLMTDGDNTLSATYPWHWGNNDNQADQKTKELCNNIKAEGISVYTVAFKVGKPSSKKMLVDCASDTSQAYDAADDAALLAAFGEIAASLAQMRLTK